MGESIESLKKEILARGNVPRHVAVIMDGNGRWAKERGLPRIAGHRAAVESVRDVVRGAGALGVEVLSLFTFSIENWNRPREEVEALMLLLEATLPAEVPELDRNNVRLHAVGRLGDLPASVRRALDEAKGALAKNTGLKLVLALSYGGQAELVDAADALARDVAAGRLRPEEIDAERFREKLYTQMFPEPDLLIRTSGEHRISNFYLWQLAYAELWFTPVYWPDFRAEHLYRAIRDYQERERRFGGVTPVGRRS
ncbi:MAG: isoprenyl transferase [Candidatus Latescibacterota bacterium]|nr:MAG: isoprenyl transferase [Candidatus Latescibacterota bacterium]